MLDMDICTGCGACAALCPTSAIAMTPGDEGFLYPDIDPGACVGCGLCADRCPPLRAGHYKAADQPTFYLAKHRDADVLRASTSGGAFTALSDRILAMGGAVYGADFDGNFRVIHTRADTAEGRDRMRFSKYVQSRFFPIYKQVEDDLQSGLPVLVTGTPCQMAGMGARFEGSPLREHLYLCDVICHSIPSPAVWEGYKALLESEAGAKLTHVQFRSKRYDWTRKNSNKGFLYRVEGDVEPREDHRFYTLFIGDNSMVRPSCYRCRFTDVRRPSDLTIADYWGIEEYDQSLYDPLGVSVVLISTPKGAALLRRCESSLHLEVRPAAESLAHQNRLRQPADEPAHRAEFWRAFRGGGFEAARELAKSKRNT